MLIVCKLLLTALLPVPVSLLFDVLTRKTAFGRLPQAVRQLLIGTGFGLVAVLGTEWGLDIGGAVINSRDAAPLCAALLFGWPAGLLAGAIGGVERWFAVLWGAGAYTRLACSVSTVLAGVLGAVARKFMFDDKRPNCIYAAVIGMMMEIIHMLMIFLMNLADVHNAYALVRLCVVPMISLNGLAVLLAALAVGGWSPINRQRHTLRRIAQTFQRYLLLFVMVGFLASTLFSWVLQTRLSENDATALIALNIEDVRQDILDASDENLLAITRKVAQEVEGLATVDKESLTRLGQKYDIAEIDIVNKRGVITASTFDDFLNYNMRGGRQSEEFLVLLDGSTNEFVQSYQATSSHSNIWRKYAGVRLPGGGFVQVAYDAARFQRDIDAQVINATHNRHVGESGCILIANEQLNIVSNVESHVGQPLNVTGITLDTQAVVPGQRFMANYYGTPSYCMYQISEGYYILAVMAQSEALTLRNVSVLVTVMMEFLVFGVLFALVYFLIKKLIVENMNRVNASLAQITHGNLEVVVDVRANQEFASLSDDINATVVTLKRYIAEAAARIDQELEYARAIQRAALPSVFPPFPDRKEFEIYASMLAAKEVGGDFYDFYFVDEEHLAFLIADVSGKGIPAAMFMMTAKTLLKGYTEEKLPVNEVLTRANEKLCEGNDAGMFVTAWMGILNTRTGRMCFANAGHNSPLLCRAGGQFEYLKLRHGFVLAGMEGIRYQAAELQLMPGDTLFLYTDGVTEATDSGNQLYGDDRLAAALNAQEQMDVEKLCRAVKEDVDRFAGEAPQFDDITMLCLHFRGGVPQ